MKYNTYNMGDLTDEESYDNLIDLKDKYETTILQKFPKYKHDRYQLEKKIIDQLYEEKL